MNDQTTKATRWTPEQAAAHVQSLTKVPCDPATIRVPAGAASRAREGYEEVRLITWRQLCAGCMFGEPQSDEEFQPVTADTMEVYTHCRMTNARASRDSCPAWRNLKTPHEAGYTRKKG